MKMGVISAFRGEFSMEKAMNFQLERQETKALNFVGGGTFGGVHLYRDRKWNRSRFVGFEPSSCGICSDVF